LRRRVEEGTRRTRPGHDCRGKLRKGFVGVFDEVKKREGTKD